MSLRIAFAGTPAFSVPALAALHDSAHEVVGVLTQPDRPAGRGRQLAASAVKEFAIARGMQIDQPQSLRTVEGRATLERWRPDVLVVVAYGLILPAAALAIPRLGCLNIHASLLPRWRGAAPIQRALLAGDSTTGVTIMLMDAGLDTGPILSLHPVPIEPEDDSARLHERLAQHGAAALISTLDAWTQGRVQPRPQPAEGVTYAAKIEKDEAIIDWQEPAIAIDRRIRAFRPWPIAETRHAGEVLRIHRARVLDEPTAAPVVAEPPGTIIGMQDEALVVACGRGRLGLLELQRPGRRVTSAREFANGMRAHDRTLG